MNMREVCGYDDATGESYGHDWLPPAPVEFEPGSPAELLSGMYVECSDCGLLEAR